MTDVSAVARILVDHAVAHYGDQVALIIAYGSRVTGQAVPGSDLDLCYIADDGTAATLSSQFVLDGLPYDFWPLSWASAEAIATATSNRPWAFSASLIARAQVLHHRSQADLDRFTALQDRVEELTRPESRDHMLRGAVKQFTHVLTELGGMRLAHGEGDTAERYAAGWRLVTRALDCLARINQTYFTGGLGKCLPQALAMRRRPEGLETMLRGTTVSASAESALDHAERLVAGVRAELVAAQAGMAKPAEPAEVFADFFFFVAEHAGKVQRACERGDAWAAGEAACALQGELSEMLAAVHRGACDGACNLLGDHRAAWEGTRLPDLLEPAARGDLEALAVRTGELQERFGKWLESHGVPLGVLRSEDELREFLAKRARRQG